MLPRTETLKIDRQAIGWSRALIECWATASPRHHDDSDLAALFLHHDMPNGPLPHSRVELIRMAVDRESPSREAFVTLALMELPEDIRTLPLGERTAKLPYQLAFARAGHTLQERTGLPGGLQRVNWPDMP